MVATQRGQQDPELEAQAVQVQGGGEQQQGQLLQVAGHLSLAFGVMLVASSLWASMQVGECELSSCLVVS